MSLLSANQRKWKRYDCSLNGHLQGKTADKDLFTSSFADYYWKQRQFWLCKDVKETFPILGLAQQGNRINTKVLFTCFNPLCACRK